MEDFNSKYTGQQVEDLLDQVASGNAGGGGGGGITVETDPIFSASPAATITEEKIAEWDAKSEQGEKGDKGDKGDTGVGVQSVAQTTTSTADGGTNVVTVTLSNGTTSTFSVKNGSKGSNGTNGTNGKDGADGKDGATFTPSVDSAGNLSWTNNKGLTNPPTVNIKGPKGDKGDAGEGGGGSSDLGKQEIVWANPEITTMRPNVIYWLDGSPFLNILDFETAPDEVDSYDVFTVVGDLVPVAGSHASMYITIPEYVRWANGQVPEIPANAEEFSFELSISRMSDGYGYDIYNAVLTPFKYVE